MTFSQSFAIFAESLIKVSQVAFKKVAGENPLPQVPFTVTPVILFSLCDANTDAGS